MAKKMLILNNTMKAIADAIRSMQLNNNDGTLYYPREMPGEILGICNYNLWFAYAITKDGYFYCGNRVKDMKNAFCHQEWMIDVPLVCGDNVTDMSSAYYNCQNINMPPVCGPNVTKASNAYVYCYNMHHQPAMGNKLEDASCMYAHSGVIDFAVCGPNVKNLHGCYEGCDYRMYNYETELYDYFCGPPVCGDKVEDLSNAYTSCTYMKGMPACGNKVENMAYAYAFCYNLQMNGVSGPNVINMAHAYESCNSLIGPAECGDNVETMSYTFYGCTNLEYNAACGPNVVNMDYAYRGCINLQGPAACGKNVNNMSHAYENCYLLGTPNVGEKVWDMSYAFANCESLTGFAQCGDKVRNMSHAYYNCKNLTLANIGSQVTDLNSAYVSCTGLTGKVVIPPTVNIAANAFNKCSQISSAEIQGDKIYADMFRNCGSLRKVVCTTTLKNILANAFRDSPYVELVATIDGSIGSGAFTNHNNESSISITTHYNGNPTSLGTPIPPASINSKTVSFYEYFNKSYDVTAYNASMASFGYSGYENAIISDVEIKTKTVGVTNYREIQKAHLYFPNANVHFYYQSPFYTP